MSSLLPLFRGLLCGSSTDPASSSSGTVVTRPGLFDTAPDINVKLLAPGPRVCVALTGPDKGVVGLPLLHKQQQTQAQQHPAAAVTDISWRFTQTDPQQQQQQQQYQQQQTHLQQPCSPRNWQQQAQQQAWGVATSLYDLDPLTGHRNGDPIADCFAAIAYQQGAVLALADGVNWGERPKAAARGAVLGFCSSLHQQLAYAQGGRTISSTAAFAAIRAAVLTAQQRVLAADGTLTTLVGAVVCPKRWGRGHVLLAVCVGDSPCYVWRAATGTIEEVTYMPPLHGFHRDPRVCPGCLGYAVGDQPDLSNITYSLTHVQQGDLVILASDGIADNFDPVMRKQALASALPSKSPRASAAAQAAAASALNGALDMTSHQYQAMSPSSPASCHAKALVDMAKVLRNACSPQQQPQLKQPQLKQPQQQQQQQQESLQQQQQQQPNAHSNTLANDGYQNGKGVSASTASNGGGIVLQTGSPSGSAFTTVTGELPLFTAGADLTPRAAAEALLGFATAVTQAQRTVLEDAAMKSRGKRDELCDVLAQLPGKLDHASVVVYKVGS